ncbi:MAG TPA: AAA family ATPase [Candidatus Rubrimentiphilum sp.]|nr:AAA family ATPase [Candidatus Rubrimentiphilum sp.]
MIAKLCAPPKGGSTASGLVEYLTGYSVAEKGASRQEVTDALEAVIAEAEARPDLGAGEIWRPVAGAGSRPSSILVRNCNSFATSALEMDGDAASNLGVKNPAMHWVFSFQTAESGRLTDEQVHQYVGEVLEKIDLGRHRSVAAVHRDTIIFDRDEDGRIKRDQDGNAIVKDGNLHVHLAIGSVSPETGLAYNKTGLYRRVAWAEREVERDHGLLHDRGLAVVRDIGTEMERVDWASKIGPDGTFATSEIAQWRRERQQERLAREQRRSFEAYRTRDQSFERYANATLAPRLGTAMDLSRERGRNPSWSELHAISARYGVSLETDADGRVILRDVGIAQMRLEHGRERKELRERLKSQTVDRDEIDRQVAELAAKHEEAEGKERERLREHGETVELDAVLDDDRADMPAFQDVEQAEAALISAIEANPKLILDDLTAQSSTFSREDLDRELCRHLSDPAEIERLGDLVMRSDNIRMLSPDAAYGLYTTIEILKCEDQLAADARTLARRESGITRKEIDRAIKDLENERSERGKTFRLNEEQREALHKLEAGSLVSIEGRPGVGKTTVMAALRHIGEQTDRDVVGLSLSQAAAERLAVEAGFATVNTSRARILEDSGTEIIPRGGIVCVDEASMIDSRTNARILALAKERGATVIEIYDTRQLQPIDYGASARIIRDVAKEAGSHAELNQIMRQKRDWHREAVNTLAGAIPERDESKRYAKVRESLEILDENGAITWVADRDEAIETAITKSRVHKAFGHDTIVAASDRDSVRHLNEEDRRRSGLEGKGLTYNTDGGKREFAPGDRLMFLENSLGERDLGVLNGDRGTVVSVKRNEITVDVDAIDGREKRTIAFSPQSYKAFDHGNASTHHKTQGASVGAAVGLIDRSASAEMVFMAASRSKHDLDLIVSRESFENLDELAEHVASRISLKTTSRNYDEILEKTGGKETLRVINQEQQRQAEPMRRLYDAEVVEPTRALREERVREIREAYAGRKREIAEDKELQMAARLEQEKKALKELRSEIRRAYTEIQPTLSFGEFLEEREQARQAARAIEQQREAKRVREQARAQQIDRKQPTITHEIEKEHGFELSR